MDLDPGSNLFIDILIKACLSYQIYIKGGCFGKALLNHPVKIFRPFMSL